ncbi:MAG: TonB-dependent receptor [Myxococcales bacterium]|nr:TonB-dependent receptor [Myxococcales bacterium]
MRPLSLIVLLASPALASPPVTPDESIEVRGQTEEEAVARDRATTRVTKKELDERLVASTPDALRFSPGVYVQQTGHGQASPFIRGRTGQNTLLLFDGLRINHALFRQGPNQYLFTVDSRTVDHIDVVRGSASVEFGADAMTGAVLLAPVDPRIDPTRAGLHAEALAAVRYVTQDDQLGGRLQLDVQLGRQTGVLLGVGARSAGPLEASGDVGHLLSQDEIGVALRQKQVPTFEENERTMMGTGFDEWTADARLVHRFSDEAHATLAAYVYRQSDAPRTDQCPPPEADLRECLTYDEQNRTHVYGRTALAPGWLLLDRVDAAAGFQRAFERRSLDRSETLGSLSVGKDGIDIWGGRLVGASRPTRLVQDLRLSARFGVDGTREAVDSSGFVELTRIQVRREQPRSQYVDGSTYAQGGAYLSPRLEWGQRASLRIGGRAAYAAAKVPGDEDSDTTAVDRSWTAFVGNVGLEVRPIAPLTVLLSVEQGFRPPNLDDISGRQATGRGYQVENADLDPERAITYEAGLRLDLGRVGLEGYVFYSEISDLMERRLAECPDGDRECKASRASVQLVNVAETATIQGVEATLRLRSWHGLRGAASVAWAEGESDSPVVGQEGERVPVSRIPPLNGTVELTWTHADSGLYLGGASRWAAEQTRLSFGDQADARIPFGGTPGYRVFDARAGIRQDRFMLAFSFENFTDEPYRIHGSSVNGPARGVAVNLTLRPELL